MIYSRVSKLDEPRALFVNEVSAVAVGCGVVSLSARAAVRGGACAVRSGSPRRQREPGMLDNFMEKLVSPPLTSKTMQ
jgi:hypothetical protein